MRLCRPLFAVTCEHIRQIEAKALPEPRPHRAPTSSGYFATTRTNRAAGETVPAGRAQERDGAASVR